MPTTTLSAKKCVNCHKDVTNSKRMKDHSGRYWCVECGTADQKKKAAAHGEVCASCGDRFPAAKLTKMGASKICPACLKRKTKGSGGPASLKGSGGVGTNKRMLITLLIVMALMAAGFWYANWG